MNRAFVASPLLGLLLTTGCGAPQSSGAEKAPTEASAEGPSPVVALFAREKLVPEAKEVKAPSGAWSARFPSETKVELVTGSGHVQAHFSLGTEATTRCFLYEQPIDSGQAISTIMASMRQKVKFERVSPYRISSAKGVPVVFIEARYVMELKEGKQLGSLKLAVSPRHQIPVLCFLDEPGYTETFASAITGLLSTMTTTEPAPEPKYSEIWQIQSGDLPLGFQWLELIEGEKDSQTTIALSATFTPTGPGELTATDAVEILELDRKGIAKGTFFESEAGQVVHELELTRAEKSQYRVTGKIQGKEFKSEFKAKGLSEDIGFYRRLLGNSKGDSKFETIEFDPSIDPSAPTKVIYSIDSKQRTVTVQVGGATFLGKLSEDGLPGELSLGQDARGFSQRILTRSGHL